MKLSLLTLLGGSRVSFLAVSFLAMPFSTAWAGMGLTVSGSVDPGLSVSAGASYQTSAPNKCSDTKFPARGNYFYELTVQGTVNSDGTYEVSGIPLQFDNDKCDYYPLAIDITVGLVSSNGEPVLDKLGKPIQGSINVFDGEHRHSNQTGPSVCHRVDFSGGLSTLNCTSVAQPFNLDYTNGNKVSLDIKLQAN